MKLTKRQSEVLTWVQRGASNKHIARNLGITESTVKLHITALFKVYAVRTRQQLALFSSQGVAVELPKDLEAKPFAWVHRHGDASVGIVFKAKQPKEGWEPLYLKRKEQL